MKVYLKFDLSNPDDLEEYKLIQRVRELDQLMLYVERELFRPARKHGYADEIAVSYLDHTGSIAALLVGRLETLYYREKQELGL